MAEIWGIPVLQAVDCAQGLEVLEREYGRIKIILLDYFMPGMEPAKCAKAIVSRAGNKIPVVLMTAAADVRVRAAELKLSRWLSKPFDMFTLEHLLTGNGSP
jgi:CheY-like chemotaxis protein